MSGNVISEFLSEASESLAKMANEAARLAQCFRANELQDGHHGLAGFTTELRQFPALVGALTESIGIDPERLRVDGVSVEAQLAQLSGWIESLIEAHRQSDWLTVADVLDLDLAPLLKAWAPILREGLAEAQ